MRITAILRAPLAHFLIAGALVFGLRERIAPVAPARAVPHRPAIRLDAARVEELRREARAQSGRDPTRAELEGLVEAAVDEELLVHEAIARGLAERDGGVETRLVQKMLFLDGEATEDDAPALLERARALGLDREDLVIRRILAEKLRLLATTLAPAETPSEAALARAYAVRRESLRTPERRSLVHVFVSRDRRGARTAADAEALRRRIDRERPTPARAIALGDPFPLGHTLARRSSDDLERSFGDRFAPHAFALPVGEWSEPIPSAYGLHLVRVDEVVAGRAPAFEDVRDRLRLELEARIRERKLAALLAELRTRYEVAVEWPDGEGE